MRGLYIPFRRRRIVNTPFNVKIVISVIGAIIFLTALMGRAFFTAINDIIVTPNIEIYVATIVDVNKDKTYFKDEDGKTYVTYTTNVVLEVEGENIELTSHSYDYYKNLKVRDKVRIYKYKDTYALTSEEFSIPPVLKVVLTVLMFLGAAMGIVPWFPVERSRSGVNRYL